jgi:hypothetical protein
VKRETASGYFKELDDNGVVESQKINRETLYQNIDIIEILGN